MFCKKELFLSVLKETVKETVIEIRSMVILLLEVNGPISLQQLSRWLGYANITSTLTVVVKKLIEEKLIRLSDPEIPIAEINSSFLHDKASLPS